MSSDNQTNLNENDTFVSDEDTEISLQPPSAPNFETAIPAPVQPVIPIVSAAGESGAFPQQPQVVYVAHPTMVEPKRGWGWIPAALALLVIAIITGVFIGAELYKRSIYAESAAPYTNGEDSPYADSTVNANKSYKSTVENTFADKKESGSPENIKTADGKSDSRQINSVSNGFAQIQQTDLKENGISGSVENSGEENNQETANDSVEKVAQLDDNPGEKDEQKSQSDDEDAPPPVKRKPNVLQPRKVENVKDTENILPPQRNIPE